MKKIFNLLFGACFRTLGKILAIFLVGALLFILGSKIGLQLPSWLALNVNAATSDGWAYDLTPIPRMNIYDASDMSSMSVSLDTFGEEELSSSDTKYFGGWNAGTTTIGKNGYLYEFPAQLEHTPNYLYSYRMGICSSKSLGNATLDLFAGQWASKVNTDIYSQSSLNSMNTRPYTTNTFNSCYILYGYYVPRYDTAWSHLRITSPDSTISSVDVFILSFDIDPVGIWSSAIEDSIANSGFSTAESVAEVQESVNAVQEEVQELNNSIDETNNTIKDNDTTGAEDSASGFFDNFTSNDFGLANIITAPLRAINAMLTDTCVAPGATYKGQTFSLPCGDMLWSRAGGQDFKNFINVMYGGFLAYYVIRKIFLDVEKLKNPDSDKVEVEKL